MQDGPIIPWTPEGQLQYPTDPRPKPAQANGTSPQRSQLIPLPPFAFVQRKEVKQESDSGCSWSQTPLIDPVDDAASKGRNLYTAVHLQAAYADA